MDEKNFEEAFKKLEEVVGKLEGGDLSLEDSLKLFEEGIDLSRFCSKKLDEAEKKVEILLKDTHGDILARPFMPGSEEHKS
ncbi:MAG: exodeoxyribonuclease VII small subunit [Thermodesulfobacteriota bacterium]|nr:exodeoxyribonuclease VII small subunit [Thermodesulfobacteriota bacterium]